MLWFNFKRFLAEEKSRVTLTATIQSLSLAFSVAPRRNSGCVVYASSSWPQPRYTRKEAVENRTSLAMTRLSRSAMHGRQLEIRSICRPLADLRTLWRPCLEPESETCRHSIDNIAHCGVVDGRQWSALRVRARCDLTSKKNYEARESCIVDHLAIM